MIKLYRTAMGPFLLTVSATARVGCKAGMRGKAG